MCLSVFAFAIKLPKLSYKPISLILGESDELNVGLVEAPNSPLPAIHVTLWYTDVETLLIVNTEPEVAAETL